MPETVPGTLSQELHVRNSDPCSWNYAQRTVDLELYARNCVTGTRTYVATTLLCSPNALDIIKPKCPFIPNLFLLLHTNSGNQNSFSRMHVLSCCPFQESLLCE